MAERKQAVVLLSGGLDSTTVLALATSQGYIVNALSINYGQRHHGELACARESANEYAHTHRIVDVPNFGGSALTDGTEVPKDGVGAGIPATYVPARNTIFLSVALALAEVVGAQDIFLGVSYVDYSGYPDCRPEYIQAFEEMANLATKSAVEGTRLTIHAPLLYLSKARTIALGLRLGVDYAYTSSCYDPNPAPCGLCDSCRLRAKGFAEVGIPDPKLEG